MVFIYVSNDNLLKYLLGFSGILQDESTRPLTGLFNNSSTPNTVRFLISILS